MKPRQSQSKTLTTTTIGPYLPTSDGRIPVEVESNEPCISDGALYDVRMGYLNTPGAEVCTRDYAYCFGKNGVIPLKLPMINPVFEDILLVYLSLFNYSPEKGLEMKDIRPLIQRHSMLKGYRLLKSIAEDLDKAKSKWKIPKTISKKKKTDETSTTDEDDTKDTKGGVIYDKKFIITGSELERLLTNATEKYTRPDATVRLSQIGIDTNISRPENFIVNYIPVLPNMMRAPRIGSHVNASGCVTGKHPFTEYYIEILKAIDENPLEPGYVRNIRAAWLRLIKDGDQESLKDSVFSSGKKAFLRGGMLAKVGGQIARSVVAPNPAQRPDQVGLPRRFAKELSHRIIVTKENLEEIAALIAEGHITHILHTETGEYIRIDSNPTVELKPGKMTVLRELQDGDVVLINRQPTLHRNSLLGFEVFLHDDEVIKIHNSATKSFGMDLTN